MKAALEESVVSPFDHRSSLAEFSARLTSALPDCTIIGGSAERLNNTVALSLPRHSNKRWVAVLDRLGFQVSTGSACATGSGAPSHVLAAMGLASDVAGRTIRVSAGWWTSQEDWHNLAESLIATARMLDEGSSSGTGTHVIDPG